VLLVLLAALLHRLRRPGIVLVILLAGLLSVAALAAWVAWRRRARLPRGGGQTGWARAADLAPLVVREHPGDRVPLGRHGRRLLAAETHQSVLVVGPSQSGKTTGLAIPAMRHWEGPVIATSVKSDLLRDTIEWRRGRGPVSVYDPTGTAGGSPTLAPGELEGWSPLLASGTWPGARRIAAAMCSVAAADHGMEDAGFWYSAAEKLLAPLLFAAATAGASMSDVVRWIDDEEVAEPFLALELAAVPDATRAARTSFSREDRQRASVFSTAETVVAGFADPGVAASTFRASLDPRTLVERRPDGGVRTLYCCAPAREQERLRPVFTALVREAMDAAFEAAARAGGRLEPGLLMVLDEAANVAPLAELDGIVSTAAGHGITLLTVWQDLAQIEARYGRRWSTIVNNHRAKVVCGGISDALTLDRLEQLIGEHDAVEVSRTVAGDGTASRTETAGRRRTASAGSLRRVPAGEAVLVYGSLPPAAISLMPEPSAASEPASPPGRSRLPGLLSRLRRSGRAEPQERPLATGAPARR